MKTFEEWVDEVDYINGIDHQNPGESFNHDSECFARYCDMQAKSAARDGYGITAYIIAQARDRAFPGYKGVYPDCHRNIQRNRV